MPGLSLRSVLLLPAAALVLLAGVSGAAEPVVTHDPSPTTLVIRLAERAGEMAGDQERSLEIWGDGRVVARRPAHAVGSRHAQARMPAPALAALLRSLAGHGVLDFDAAATAAGLDAAREARLDEARRRPGGVVLTWESDPDVTTLEVHVARYEPEGPGGPVLLDVAKTIEWIGLRGDAASHPELAALGGLLAAQDEVARLFASEDLR